MGPNINIGLLYLRTLNLILDLQGKYYHWYNMEQKLIKTFKKLYGNLFTKSKLCGMIYIWKVTLSILTKNQIKERMRSKWQKSRFY